MSKNKQNDNWLASLIEWAIVYLMIGVTVGLTWSMRVLFALAKQSVSEALHLKSHSARWPTMKWLYKPLKWITAIQFLFITLYLVVKVVARPVHTEELLVDALYLFIGLSSALLFNVIDWLEQYYDDPLIQKKVAGNTAERFVQKTIETNAARYPESRSLHGALFVFKAGTADEFSVEADHILITQRTIFLIETKFKSGTISAPANAPQWQTVSSNGNAGVMRNALKQVKNTLRVIERECGLAGEIVPLVVMYGNDVRIVDGPGNVVSAIDIIKAIDAFELMAIEDAEQSGITTFIHPKVVAAALMKHVFTEPTALERHIERANQARLRAELKTIVTSASLR